MMPLFETVFEGTKLGCYINLDRRAIFIRENNTKSACIIGSPVKFYLEYFVSSANKNSLLLLLFIVKPRIKIL